MGETAAGTIAGVPTYLTQAGAYSGPTGYRRFYVSVPNKILLIPHLAEFDKQAAARSTRDRGQLATRSQEI